jgi:hypothetical protein
MDFSKSDEKNKHENVTIKELLIYQKATDYDQDTAPLK